IRELAIAGIALVREPRLLGAPEDVLIRLPDVLAPGAESEGLEGHRLERDVAGEDDEVGPRDLPAVLLLDRPEQPARLVQADVVRPRVQRSEALLSPAPAAPAVAGAIRAGAVPSHADEEPAVVTEVRRPPVLRIGHQREQILLQRRVVEALDLGPVVEAPSHRVRLVRMLM